MVERIAIKNLAASDCTLFKAVFQKINSGNQKSITLNASILTGQFYPDLAATAAAIDGDIPLAITIYGPAAKGAHKVSRKIIKSAGSKNWRLNGEVIDGLDNDPSRYDDIRAGDLAIMVFKGDAVPNRMDLIIVSQSDPADVALHGALVPLFSNKSMISVTPVQIADAATTAAVSEAHPVRIAAADPELEAALEDAAQGGAEGISKLLKNQSSRKVSGSDLAKAKAIAELTGQDGEGLIDGHLAAKVAAGDLASYTWASSENAIAPFDFASMTPVGQRTLIDVKTTSGPFENVIHLSLAETIEASGADPYLIYRVFGLDEDGGKLRISEDIKPIARLLKAVHEAHMPSGIRVDGFSIAVSAIKWGAEELVARRDSEEGA